MPFHTHAHFPKAILHVDGDSFFTACEVAVHPELRGKPVVTGKERGIASAVSYDLKARGITRAMPLHEIRRLCPEAVILPSDYETYSLFSKRMYDIVRRYTEKVEEYSIDECFADLTGMRRPLHLSYEAMAAKVQEELHRELGITFSVGLGPSKVLAKVASKWRKPAGLTAIRRDGIDAYLRELPVRAIWGIGRQTSAYLEQLGVHTALQYAQKPEAWIDARMSKPYKELWQELRGESVLPLACGERHDYESISKTRTVTPPSTDPAFILSQLAKNIENACIKARRHDLAPKKVSFFLKTQEFRYAGAELTLSAPLSAPHEILRLAKTRFADVYRPRTPYRATGVVLAELAHEGSLQLDLFGHVASVAKWRPVYAAMDAVDRKFGKHTVFLASTLRAITDGAHAGARGEAPSRSVRLLRHETKRQRIGLPFLGEVV